MKGNYIYEKSDLFDHRCTVFVFENFESQFSQATNARPKVEDDTNHRLLDYVDFFLLFNFQVCKIKITLKKIYFKNNKSRLKSSVFQCLYALNERKKIGVYL